MSFSPQLIETFEKRLARYCDLKIVFIGKIKSLALLFDNVKIYNQLKTR